MTGPMEVRDYMAGDFVSFTPDTDIHRAIRVLVSRQISGAPVIDENGELVGLLSEKDCFQVAFGASYHQDRAGRVADFMTVDVETVDAASDLVEVAERFLRGRFRRFPVVEGGRVVGVIARRDALRGLTELG